MFDLDGKMLKHIRVGHNQSPSVGKYLRIFRVCSI